MSKGITINEAISNAVNPLENFGFKYDSRPDDIRANKASKANINNAAPSNRPPIVLSFVRP